jgi:hypothetical protein
MNTLYYGDNLDILRRYVHDESVDLIYLDRPDLGDAARGRHRRVLRLGLVSPPAPADSDDRGVAGRQGGEHAAHQPDECDLQGERRGVRGRQEQSDLM